MIRSARNLWVSIERSATGRYQPDLTLRAKPNASFRSVLSVCSFKAAAARPVGFYRIGGGDLVVEGTALELLEPDADHVTPTSEAVERLARR